MHSVPRWRSTTPWPRPRPRSTSPRWPCTRPSAAPMPAPATRRRGRAWPPRNGCRRWATEPVFTMHGGRRGHAASMDWIEQLRVLPAVVYAMALGGAIGFERELKNRPAGFRTHMLVAGTSALLLGLGRMVLEDDHYAGTGLRIDPLRLVEAVVAGVSFIGAGTIFASRKGDGVQGITTAASLL